MSVTTVLRVVTAHVAAATALLGAISAPLNAQDPRPLEIEDMFSMRNVGSPVVSPDGEWI